MHPFHRVRVDDQGDLSGRLERYLKCWTQEGFEDVMREPDAFHTGSLPSTKPQGSTADITRRGDHDHELHAHDSLRETHRHQTVIQTHDSDDDDDDVYWH